MIKLLSKLLIKNHTEYDNAGVRLSYGKLCSGFGIFLNFLLFIFKFIAGSVSGSIAITADAFNNLSDAGSSTITLLGFKLAGQKPDPEHPFGHGRMEYISGLLVSVVIMIMAYELIKDSIQRIITPEPLESSLTILLILLVSILVKVYMSLYNRIYGQKLNSQAMLATAKDSISDVISTTVVLICTVIHYYSGLSLDAYCGVLVGVLIAYVGFSSLKDTISPLLGTPPSQDYVKDIESIVLSHENIIGIHDLIVHDYGPGRKMVSLHAEVPSTCDILNIHDTIDNIEHDIFEELGTIAVIHMDPVLIGDPLTDRLKEAAIGILKNIDERLTLHDFRIVKGPSHTNILFDIVKPYRLKMTDDELKFTILAEFKKIDNHYFTVLEIDNDYIGTGVSDTLKH